MRSGFLAGSALILGTALLLGLALPSHAAPGLFVGNLSITSNYNPMPLFCGPGPDPSCTTPPVRIHSVTPSRGFTVPSNLFGSMQSTFPNPFPGYPAQFTQYQSRYQTGQGIFYSGYQPPGVSITFSATSVAPPQASTPRVGMLRIVPGPNGFGGKMHFKDYVYFYSEGPGFYSESSLSMRTFMLERLRGAGPIGGMGSALRGTASHTGLKSGGGSPLMQSSQGATTRAGWFTGTITVTDQHLASAMFSTITAMDNRNVAGSSGSLSLVSPLLVWAYNGTGGSVQVLRVGLASYSRLSLRSLPEPSRPGPLAAGVLGLMLLWKLRRFEVGPTP